MTAEKRIHELDDTRIQQIVDSITEERQKEIADFFDGVVLRGIEASGKGTFSVKKRYLLDGGRSAFVLAESTAKKIADALPYPSDNITVTHLGGDHNVVAFNIEGINSSNIPVIREIRRRLHIPSPGPVATEARLQSGRISASITMLSGDEKDALAEVFELDKDGRAILLQPTDGNSDPLDRLWTAVNNVLLGRATDARRDHALAR